MDIDFDTKLSKKELKNVGDLITGLSKDGNLELAQALRKMAQSYLKNTKQPIKFEEIFDASHLAAFSALDKGMKKSGGLLSTGQVAKKFGVSNQTILNWIENGKIEATQTPGGHWRIPAHQFRTTEEQDEKFDKFLKRMWDKHKDLPPITDDDLEGI